jgi:hypothetical protein
MVTYKVQIQNVMIEITSHGYGIYLLVLIKLFQFALKRYSISKTVRSV